MNDRTQRIWNERWELAALERQELIRYALVAVIIGLFFFLFHLLGSSTDVKLFGRSLFTWVIGRWNGDGLALGAADYSHGWLIPVASGAVVWWKREELARAPKAASYIGLSILVFSLFLHWLGAKAEQPRLSLAALILLTWSIPFYLCGWQTARHLIFPCSYLLFCIPMNFLDSLTVPLRIHMTGAVAWTLNGIGFEYVSSGTGLYSVAGKFGLEIADPCSGIRSLLAMTAITAIYGYTTQKTLLKKWVLFLSAIPIAVAGNMARIVTIAVVSEAFGRDIGSGLYHDFSGYLIFLAISIPLMILLGNLLDHDYRGALRKWKNLLLNPIS